MIGRNIILTTSTNRRVGVVQRSFPLILVEMKSASASDLKAARVGMGVTGRIGTNGQLSKDGGLELEVSCGRETGTFNIVQLFSLGVQNG